MLKSKSPAMREKINSMQKLTQKKNFKCYKRKDFLIIYQKYVGIFHHLGYFILMEMTR